MKRANIVKLSYLYVGLSIIIGPALPFLSLKLFPIQIACFDIEPSATFQYTEIEMAQIPTHEVVRQYFSNAFFLILCAGVMIVLGALLLKSLHSRKQTAGYKQRAVPTFLIIMVLLGYGLILAFAGLEIWCGSL